MKAEQSNEPFGKNDEVESEEFGKNLDRDGSLQRETPMTKFNNEVPKLRLTMTVLMDQNQLLVEIIKSGKSSLLDATKPNYIKNVLKPTTWDTLDKGNIEGFLIDY